MNAPTGLDPPATHQELVAFFQSSEDYYLAKWRQRKSSKSFFAGFNWGAFVFGAVWFFYRRLWKGAAFCYLAAILFGILLSGPPFLLAVLLCRLLLGTGANSYYFRKTRAILAGLRTESLGPTPQLERLEKLGGTSETAVVIAISANFLRAFLVMIASHGAA
jgi:hypothetical protein